MKTKSLLLIALLPSYILATPLAPSNLMLTPTTNSVTISWQDNSKDESGFKIFRNGELITQTNADVTTYTDRGLRPSTTYTYEVRATNDLPQQLIDGIVDRHNYYRSLEFTDSPLAWDEKLASHAQAWADYLSVHYTQADADAREIPHASKFQTDKHNEDDYKEGENIAWGLPSRVFLNEKPVDISSIAVADAGVSGAVDAWASEKAYYDYENNKQKAGYESEAIGHYTQLAWQKSQKIGCGKATSQTNYGGDWVVCRYAVPGNLNNDKPYCSYSVADLYGTSLKFTSAMIDGKSFVITKVLEDRENCTRKDVADSTLTFTGTNSASIPQYNTFNTTDNSNLRDMNFDHVTIEADGSLTLTNNANDRFMTLKIIGDLATHYSVEAYWWVIEEKYNRSGILKLAK